MGFSNAGPTIIVQVITHTYKNTSHQKKTDIISVISIRLKIKAIYIEYFIYSAMFVKQKSVGTHFHNKPVISNVCIF